MIYQTVETPFQYRYSCWFCGEPAARCFSFPQPDNIILNRVHPSLSLNGCDECCRLAYKCQAQSIWRVRQQVKQQLLQLYQKDLAIGINWTKEELANSGFEGGNFAGFQQSAWMMFEIAKARVNFSGWPLVVAGLELESLQWQAKEIFCFDGIEYPSTDDAAAHYAKAFDLHLTFFRQVLHRLGQDNFAQAVRFCRLLLGSTPDERKAALKQLSLNERG